MVFGFKKRVKETSEQPRSQELSPDSKAFKASKGTKFVLFIGDEGAILVYIKGNQVLSRQFVPDASPNNLEEFKETFAKDSKAPIILVIDSMDQTYVQQTLPPVSPLSVGKLIKRRLDRDFGTNDIKGAVMLGREKSGRKDWNFMMIALEKSQQLTIWLDFLMELPNRFKGIHLVSVETENIIKTLEKAVGIPKTGTGSEWKFFISHNKVGGFRQVILRNGRIIFTRLAQPLGEANSEVIAGNIEQEMLSTIEYMKRLSYNPQSGLDIYIVASSGIKEAIDVSKFNATNTSIYTPYEIAQYFGIEGATQPTDQFGDVVLASIIGSSKNFVLTLSVPQFKTIDKYYGLIITQRTCAAALILGMLGYSGYTGIDILGLISDSQELERKRVTEQNTLTALRNEIKRTNLDVDKATDMIDLYKQLQKENDSPLPIVEKIRPLIVSPVVLKGLEWSIADEKTLAKVITNNPNGQSVASAPLGKMINLTLTLEFPAAASSKKGRAVLMDKVISVLSNGMPGYEVRPEKTQEEAVQNNDQFKASSKEAESAQSDNKVSATPISEKIIISGPIDPEAAASATKAAPALPVSQQDPAMPDGVAP